MWQQSKVHQVLVMYAAVLQTIAHHLQVGFLCVRPIRTWTREKLAVHPTVMKARQWTGQSQEIISKRRILQVFTISTFDYKKVVTFPSAMTGLTLSSFGHQRRSLKIQPWPVSQAYVWWISGSGALLPLRFCKLSSTTGGNPPNPILRISSVLVGFTLKLFFTLIWMFLGISFTSAEHMTNI